MKIFLIGMPGSGKSTVARLLANNIGYELHDMDQLIEKRAGQSITEIFADKGEATFRALESKVLKELVDLKSTMVVSCGGGTPCFHDNLELMNQAGITIYIKIPQEILIQRTSKNHKRPLLKGNPQQRIRELIKQRESYYSRASFIIDGRNLDSEQVAASIPALIGFNPKT